MTSNTEQYNVEALKEELMKCLGARDPKSLSIIHKLKQIATEKKDNGLLGYAYYRYAYFYYFSQTDRKKFRRNLQLAIRYLLRSRDMEYLGGAYNLVAYDAQDQGYYDVAYAYFMIAFQAASQVDGIALPGLIEANAGRILLELGEYRQGRKQLADAARRTRPYTTLHVYHYNMIFTHADVALASFLLGDAKGVKSALTQIGKHRAKASENEINLSRTYYLLPCIYRDLLEEDAKALSEDLKQLLDFWTGMESDELSGLIFEIETMYHALSARDMNKEAKALLETVRPLGQDENISVALRYHTMQVVFCEKTGNKAGLRRALRAEFETRKAHAANTMKLQNYMIEFANMIENITKEREQVREENRNLQEQVNTDALTKLPNRNALNSRFSEMFEEAQKNRTNFGIGVIDVDGFKQYNDTYGHQAGDLCLQMIGKILLSFSSDPRVFCARYGGDEFAVGYFGMSDEEIGRVARRMEERVERETSLSGIGIGRTVRISQGICNQVPDKDQRFWDFISMADRDLYRIKKGG